VDRLTFTTACTEWATGIFRGDLGDLGGWPCARAHEL